MENSFTSYLLGYDPFAAALPTAPPSLSAPDPSVLTKSLDNPDIGFSALGGTGFTPATPSGFSAYATSLLPAFNTPPLYGGFNVALPEKTGTRISDFIKEFLDRQSGKATGTATPAQQSAAYATTQAGALPKQDDGVLRWADQINSAASATGVPSYVIAAIMQGESGGDAGALSPQGASGLMQIMPNYHADLISKYGGNVMDPQTNILVGASILKSNFDQAKKLYGSSDADAWNIAAAAYLGDWDWQSGSYAGTADALGTTGSKYVSTFDKNLQKYQQMLQSPASPQVSGKSGSVIDTASQYIGNPYVWGGDSPSQGFDCSGLVQYSYKQAGVNLPRTAQEQYNATSRIDASQLQPGDLVFFTGTYDAGVPVTHVGIYVGDGKMLDSQSNGIQYDNLSDPYWQQHLYGYGRVGG